MIGLDDMRLPKLHLKEHDYNKKVWFLFEKQVISHSATENPTRRVVPEWASKAKNPHSKLKIRWNPTPLVGISRSHYPRVPLVVPTLAKTQKAQKWDFYDIHFVFSAHFTGQRP